MTPEEYRALHNISNSTNSTNTTSPRVLLDNGYVWEAPDYVQAPFALVIGALHALPTASFGYKCSKNTTSARASLIEAFDYFNQTEIFDGV
jgi:hypothetical protein